MSARGWAVYAVDTRAHGRSPGAKVHVQRFDEFLEDVRSMLAAVRARRSDGPVFLLGHSQGGLVVLQYALRQPERLARIVVTSPSLDAQPALRRSATFRLASAVLRCVVPHLRLTSGVDPEGIYRDPEVVKAYGQDPLVTRRVSPGSYADLRRAQAEVRAGSERLSAPAVVLASPDERLVDPEAVRHFVARAPSGRVQTSWWPGLGHELLNEPERNQVLATIDVWLRQRLQNTLMER
jgi:lysophospholipase